jgi:o-succinylbenzoate synthase
MRIATHPYKVAFRRPFHTAKMNLRERRGYLISCTENDEQVGWGEAAPLDGMSPEEDHEVRAGLLLAAAFFKKIPAPTSVERLAYALQELDSTLESLPASVACGLELAFLSLAESSTGVPVARLLGYGGEAPVPVSGLLTTDETVVDTDLALLRAHGITSFKIKLPFGTPRYQAERVMAVRDRLQGVEQIRLDCNQMLDFSGVMELFHNLGTARIQFIEEPLASSELWRLDELASEVAVQIALDESLLVRKVRDAALERAPQYVFVLKPTLLGGIRRTIEAGLIVLDRGGKVVITSTLEWGFGLRSAYLAASLVQGPRVLPAGILTDQMFASSLATFSVREGAVHSVELGSLPTGKHSYTVVT